VFEQGAQALRNRLVEDVIIERMEDVLPIALAGKKVADIFVDRRWRDPVPRREAFLGDADGHDLFPAPGDLSLSHLEPVHRVWLRVQLMAKCQQFVTPDNRNEKSQCSHAFLRIWVAIRYGNGEKVRRSR
jgi:hypothetical protein